MGGCYSKTGHEVDSAYRENRKPLDKRKSKNSIKNGSVKNKYDTEFPNNPGVVQNDLSDTVYTEDSHTCHAVEDCLNKSQQTSLDHLLIKDANKNIEALTSYSKTSDTLCNSDNFEASTSDSSGNALCSSENIDVCDGKVVTSDSGIVVENTERLNHALQTEKNKVDDVPKIQSDTVQNRPISLPLSLEPVHSCTCSSSELTNPVLNRSQTEHSTGSPGNYEGDKRRSVTSVDRSIGESSTDLNKIKLAIRQSSVSTPIEERSFGGDPSDTSYEVNGAIQQPEVTTMVMNGREVVVIDSELFSQILDEIQMLKMKLSQLTEVIEHDLSQGEGTTNISRQNTFEEETDSVVDVT